MNDSLVTKLKTLSMNGLHSALGAWLDARCGFSRRSRIGPEPKSHGLFQCGSPSGYLVRLKGHGVIGEAGSIIANTTQQTLHDAEAIRITLGQADIGRTRVYLWYWLKGFFLPPDGSANPNIIARLPNRLIHGADDLICLIGATRQFAMQGGLQFYEVPETGHDRLAPEMVAAVRQAIEGFER